MTKKVLFVHDGPIYKEQSDNYYGLHFTDDLRKRYLHLGENVTFLMRVHEIPKNEIHKYTKINNENFSVISVPNFKSFELFFKNITIAKTIINQAVESHDIIMVRLPSSIGALAVKYAKKYNKPLISEVVSCNWDSSWNYNWKGKLLAPYLFLKERHIMKSMPYSIYVSNQFFRFAFFAPQFFVHFFAHLFY